MTMQRREHTTITDSSTPEENHKNRSGSRDNSQEWEDEEENLTQPLFSSEQESYASSRASSMGSDYTTNVGKFREELKKRRVNSRSSYMCYQVVEKMQSIYLPKRFSSYIPVARGESHPSGRIPLVKNLDKVVNGTQPASEVVYVCGMKPVRYLWYMLSGVCCDIIQLTIDTLYFYTLHVKDPSACWILGFGTSIIFRHSFHRYLVFGDYVGGYWRSLMRMYGGYSIIMVISTIFNIIMTKVFDIPHYTAWAATLLWTGIVNYFILKHVWTFGGNAEKQRSVELPSRSTQIV